MFLKAKHKEMSVGLVFSPVGSGLEITKQTSARCFSGNCPLRGHRPPLAPHAPTHTAAARQAHTLFGFHGAHSDVAPQLRAGAVRTWRGSSQSQTHKNYEEERT